MGSPPLVTTGLPGLPTCHEDFERITRDDHAVSNDLGSPTPCGFLGLLRDTEKQNFQTRFEQKQELKKRQQDMPPLSGEGVDWEFQEWEYLFCIHTMKRVPISRPRRAT
eukprot:TRINITY_DN7273_c0_g1_i1.p2 TRINITY_DN7273_c0_g1~~TRINITY_DN7273_c0_g1_i1.p2  ORF type:complete len:109 (+),score=9.91 TRINITY_DN7273_c0_g1_i1:64-390(+)